MRERIKHGIKQCLVEVHILGVKKYAFWSASNEESRAKAPVILRNNVKRRKRHLVDPEPVYLMGNPPEMQITEIHFTALNGVIEMEGGHGQASRYQRRKNKKKNKKKENFRVSCPRPVIRAQAEV